MNEPLRVRRALLKAAAGVVAALGLPAWSEDKTIRIVLPFPAGGILDVIVRFVAKGIAGPLNRPVFVDNRPGAAGVIGTHIVQAATPDGSTLLFQYIGLVGLPFTQKGANYDPIKDFAPIAIVAEGPAYIVVNGSVPATNLAEFIAWAKTVPNGVESATSGPGGGSHTWTLLLAKRAGINLLPVPYKGGAEQSMAIIQGDAKVLISNMSDSINAQVKAGKLRILAVCSERRSSITPDVPLARDTVPGFVIAGWEGLLAPAGTPAPVIDSIAAAVKQVVADPAYRANCLELFSEPRFEGPAEFAKTLVETTAFWKSVVNDLDITPQ